MSTVLITAGAYIGPELAAEFGSLPPAFLPVGNRRLHVYQTEELKGRFDRIIMSLPDDFSPDPHDLALLAAGGVELIFVPRGLSLPASILYVVAEANIEDGPFAVLHGDTLIFDIDLSADDALSIASARASYQWAGGHLDGKKVVRIFDVLQGDPRDVPVLSGFFNFSDLNLLVLSLATSKGFVEALDRYVAKRPMTALRSERWLDFGHLHTYYSSRGLITTERAFNALTVQARSIRKHSTKADRVDAEAHWYENVPSHLRIFLPQYLGRLDEPHGKSYALEFLYMASLADLFVFGALPTAAWLRIFGSANEFLRAAAQLKAPALIAESVMDMYLPKTMMRLEQFSRECSIDLNHGWTLNGVPTPGLAEIARSSAKNITSPEVRHLTLVHGDSCLSNILYDFRSQSVRLIDPRGQGADGSPSIWGDNRYDLAKLHHSIYGMYDLIVAGYCQSAIAHPYVAEIVFPGTASLTAARAAYDQIIVKQNAADMQAVNAITLHLFLSMLPLHSDSPVRQQAMLANALRLYLESEAGEAN